MTLQECINFIENDESLTELQRDYMLNNLEKDLKEENKKILEQCGFEY